MEAFLKNYTPKGTSDKKTAEKNKPIRQKLLPWVEKYRPKAVDEIAFQEEVVQVLLKCIQGADLPNFLFYGPPGTGKTSAALAIAKDLFGAKLWKDRVLELNASDERGIQVVRQKVKEFAQLACASNLIQPDGRLVPALRLIILDEADSMTRPAQDALRRTMEKESKTTRFVLICNYISRIIGPLASRCAKFRFKPLSSKIMMERLTAIAEKEELTISGPTVTLLSQLSGGDLRKAITLLQSASKCQLAVDDVADDEAMETDHSDIIDKKKFAAMITDDLIREVAMVIPDAVLQDMFESVKFGHFEKFESFVRRFMRTGYPVDQLISQVFDALMQDPTNNILMEAGIFFDSDAPKARLFERLAEIDKALLDGADAHLQLLDLGCCLMEQVRICKSA